jgi:hypothetical protein
MKRAALDFVVASVLPTPTMGMDMIDRGRMVATERNLWPKVAAGLISSIDDSAAVESDALDVLEVLLGDVAGDCSAALLWDVVELEQAEMDADDDWDGGVLALALEACHHRSYDKVLALQTSRRCRCRRRCRRCRLLPARPARPTGAA